MLSKKRAQKLTLSQLIVLLLVLSSAAIWLSWSWWNSKGLFKTPQPVAVKIEHTDFTKGAKYVIPDVSFTSLVEGAPPEMEWAVEYSSNNAIVESNQKKKLKRINHRVPVIAPFWQVDFQLPEEATGKTRFDATRGYFIKNLEDSVVAEGEHLLPYTTPQQEQEKVMESSCAHVRVECKVEERNDRIYFRVITTYSRFMRLQLDHSPPIFVDLASRYSPVYIGTKVNVISSMKTIMQIQVKEILTQLRSQSVEVDFEQHLPPDPNYVPPITSSSMSISTNRRDPNYVSPVDPSSIGLGNEQEGR